jgi:hypothetical protein
MHAFDHSLAFSWPHLAIKLTAIDVSPVQRIHPMPRRNGASAAILWPPPLRIQREFVLLVAATRPIHSGWPAQCPALLQPLPSGTQ